MHRRGYIAGALRNAVDFGAGWSGQNKMKKLLAMLL
jgi:hypothetical protein